MPNNMQQSTHTLARALAAETLYADALGGRTLGMAVHSLERYALLLKRLGFAEQHTREMVYVHALPSRDAVVEWVRGSMLTWYRNALGPDLFASFFETYRARLLAALPDDAPLPFTYRRMLLWARLADA